MRHRSLRAVAIAILLSLLATPAWAGFAEGVAAYERGDYATALRELQPLANQGDARAQNRLGFMYRKGWGVLQDYAEAAKWYRKAAEQGDADAQNNLGMHYVEGRGVPQDNVQAYMWLSLAAMRGDKKATQNLNSAAEKMSPAQIVKAQRRAREWKPKKEGE